VAAVAFLSDADTDAAVATRTAPAATNRKERKSKLSAEGGLAMVLAVVPCWCVRDRVAGGKFQQQTGLVRFGATTASSLRNGK
jgi:hypothetical protein